MQRLRTGLMLFLLLVQTAKFSHAETPESYLVNLSLEELANIQITSVSKRPERLSDAAAFVYVITNEDIHRAGVTNLPDALRLAPNLHVAQSSAADWDILPGTQSNKMLVLIDGRIVYSPLLSGVHWDAQNVMLEDLDRIEVISGPGGTLWGTNAVDGVINIITRSANKTQGGLMSLGAGNLENNAGVRYGGKLGDDGYYRVYGKYFDVDNTSTENGTPKDDAWHMRQVGFRADWNRSANQVSINGNAYSGSKEQPLPGAIGLLGGPGYTPGDIPFSGLNLTALWTHLLDGGSSLSVQAYYDRTERTVTPLIGEKIDIYDLQVQHTLRPIAAHALIWGASYRHAVENVSNSPSVGLLPAHLHQRWSSLFAQDEITLRDNLKLTLGARFERNDYTGTEFLPTVRLAWKVTPQHLVWGAVSRAVRAPSRLDRDAFIPSRPPFLLNGGPTFRSEVANVFEVGYRGQPASRFTYSVTAYHTIYDHQRTLELNPGRTVITNANGIEGKATGIGMWGTYQAASNWRLSAGFSARRTRLHLKPGHENAITNPTLQEGLQPDHRLILRSSLDLTPRSNFDAIVRHVAATAPSVPKYTALDLHYGWRPRRDLKFSITGRNLLNSGHGESGYEATRTEIRPSVFFNVVARLD